MDIGKGYWGIFLLKAKLSFSVIKMSQTCHGQFTTWAHNTPQVLNDLNYETLI